MRPIKAVTCIFVLLFCASVYCDIDKQKKRVCIIGAGIGGLTSARYLQEEGIEFTVLEATRYVGGTWRYDPRVGTDEYGLPVHTSMYKNLRTNLPKPTMQLRGFPIPEDLPSFPSGQSFYNYIQSYAKRFDLEKYIKFLHLVTSVRGEEKVWKVKHKYLPTGEEFENEYEYVIVATGHFSKPHWPNITGEDIFKGTIIHSHDYRTPDPYTDRRVLVIGNGPSGLDISIDITNVSRVLYHSQHSKAVFNAPYPDNYVRKPDVEMFNETGALFKDGTFAELDHVIYCTGYEFNLPFLDNSSGLMISPKTIVPLYNYMVNIHQPTMMLLGAVVRACFTVVLDTQARYATALIKGNFTLPSEVQMLERWQSQVNATKSSKSLSEIHVLGPYEGNYYKELSKESGIDPVPPVLVKIRDEDGNAKIENLYTYRNYEYTIISDDSFIRQVEIKNNSMITPL